MKDAARLLLDLFPERLHGCLLHPIPPRFAWIWNIVKKVIHPVTRDKICHLWGANKIESPPRREQMLEHMSKEAADCLQKERVDSFEEQMTISWIWLTDRFVKCCRPFCSVVPCCFTRRMQQNKHSYAGIILVYFLQHEILSRRLCPASTLSLSSQSTQRLQNEKVLSIVCRSETIHVRCQEELSLVTWQIQSQFSSGSIFQQVPQCMIDHLVASELKNLTSAALGKMKKVTSCLSCSLINFGSSCHGKVLLTSWPSLAICSFHSSLMAASTVARISSAQSRMRGVRPPLQFNRNTANGT
jgi:hypothetical protein